MSDTCHVGLVLGSSDPYARLVLKGATRYARSMTDWRLEHLPAVTPKQLDALMQRDVGGFIVGPVDAAVLQRLAATGKPVVSVSNDAVGSQPLSAHPDHEQIGRLAASTLVERAFRRFGFCGFEAHRASSEMLAGFRDAIADRHHTVDVLLLDRHDWNSADVASRPQLLSPWLRRLQTPVGLLAINDELGAALCEACDRVGRQVPDDVAVIGVGNDEVVCEMTNPPLSSVDIAPERVGYAAARLLHEKLQGCAPDPPVVRVRPLEVVTRQSSDQFAVDDPTVHAALRFIHDNATRGIGVPDVVKHTGVSRRWLELCFSRTLGRAPATQIRLTQIEHAKRLLARTDLMMPDVARAAGLRDAKLLIAVMRRHLGMTPTAYRRKSRQLT